MECALCGMKCPGHERLGRHVIKEHEFDDVAGRRMEQTCGMGDSQIRCWCGLLVLTGDRWFWAGRGPQMTLGQHLKERGGMAAHILELALGICQEGER